MERDKKTSDQQKETSKELKQLEDKHDSKLSDELKNSIKEKQAGIDKPICK